MLIESDSPPIASYGANPGGSADTGARRYIGAVYNYMAGGLATTGVVAYIAATTGFYARIAGTPIMWGVMLAPLALVLFLSLRIESMSISAARTAYWSYAALLGLSLAGIFLFYTGQSIARVFFISAATFSAMSAFGYTTRTDLSRLGSFLLMGLIGVVIAGLANILMASSALQFAVSVIGVIVFVGLTAYDTQKLLSLYATTDGYDMTARKVVMGALTLYLDFINLFLMLLRLFGDRRAQ
jgi:uncharacterized protein